MHKESNTRTKKLYSNVIGSSLFKGINILFSLLIVRFSIQLIGEEKYGIWLALLSFFTLFSAFEVGITSSLRNPITLLFSQKKFEAIRQLVNQGYKALFVIYFGLITLLLLLSFQTELNQLILPKLGNYESFNLTFQLGVTLYFFHFIFYFLHSILLATHYTKYSFLITAIQNGVLLSGLLFCYYLDYTPSLLLFCLWFSSLPLMIWAFSSLFYYRIFNSVRPNLKEIVGRETKVFKGLNKDYLLIQICVLILFSTDNIIIVNFIGSYEVTVYNVTFKYFNILIILFNLILVPYWASFTDAYGKGDKKWILSHMKKLILFWLGIGLLGVLMFVFSKEALKVWIGKELTVSFYLLLFMFVSILLTSWNSIFAYFLNSISKTRLQMKLLLFGAIINIPLSVYLITYFNTAGVIIATCISLLPQAILLPLQYRSLVLKMKQIDGI